MKRPLHSRASRYVRLRRRPAARRDVVSPGERLVRVEHVGRVEGGSSEPVATRPLVWNFSTFQPFNLFTSYYTHDNSPRVEQETRCVGRCTRIICWILCKRQHDNVR